MQMELFAYLAASVRNQGYTCLIVGGQTDHVHLLVGTSPTLLTADMVKEIKRSSSVWIKGKGAQYGDFSWQSGYGAFAVSYSNLQAVTKYIANQDQHHHAMSWDDELRTLLEKHGIEFDEMYFLD